MASNGNAVPPGTDNLAVPIHLQKLPFQYLPFYLKDIAHVALGTDDQKKQVSKLNGKRIVALSISNSQDASGVVE